MGFGAYGISSEERSAAAEYSDVREEIAVRGFAAVEGVLSASEVDHLNGTMDAVYERQCQEVGGEEALISIGDADIVRCLLAYDEAYMALATNPTMSEIARSVLGENIVLIMQNGIINRPDRVQFQTKWHRDLNYQHWTISKPIAISALVCLEDFNDVTGGTVFLPGSHKFERFPSEALTIRAEVAPQLSKGSIILFDSMVFHRAGINKSDKVRRGVNHVFGAPILSQQVNIPAMLNRPAPSDPSLSGLLGYRWNPMSDVSAWRRRKIDLASRSAQSAGFQRLSDQT